MPGRTIAIACLLAATVIAPVPVAVAQDGAAPTTVVPSINPSDQLDGTTPSTEELAPGTTPGGVTPGGVTPGTVAPDDAELPPASSTTAPAPTTPGSTTPTPPPYLAPGADAEIQPVSSVATLTAPQLPLEPLRLAALIAALLAILLVAGATLLRTLGVRSAAGPAVVATTSGDSVLARTRERLNALADDVRDFLRHSR